MPTKFAGKLDKSTKRGRGRTGVDETPIAVRSSIALALPLQRRIRTKLARRLRHAVPLIERGTVRFDDINGPRGGVDTICKIKLVLSGRPSVQAEDRARNPETAFDRATHKVERSLSRVRGKHALTTGRRRVERTTSKEARAAGHSTARVRSERRPVKLEVTRPPPSRRKAKAGARRAKQRVRVGGGKR